MSERLGAMSEHLGAMSERLGAMSERLGTMSERLGTMSKRVGSTEFGPRHAEREIRGAVERPDACPAWYMAIGETTNDDPQLERP